MNKSDDVTCPFREIDGSSFKPFMQWLADNGGFNDLYIMTGYQVFARIQGKIEIVVKSALSVFVVEQIAQEVSGNDLILSVLVAGDQFDGLYELYDENIRGLIHRFRVNIKGIRSRGAGGSGVAITIRQISIQAPSVKELRVEQEIIDSFTPRNGLVIVSGPTGSGKSTLYASLIGNFAENLGRDFVIGTCEQPIEYVFDHIAMKSVVIYQSSIDELGGNIRSFDAGVRASLRSGTDGTIIGELRDLPTIRAALTAANTGQVVWGTLHVNSVVDIPSRIINVFPSEEMNKVRVEFFSNIRFLMTQILVPSIKPGKARVAVKEWLKLTKRMQRELIEASPSDAHSILAKLLSEHGMPMTRYAQNLLSNGEISEETFNYICEGE